MIGSGLKKYFILMIAGSLIIALIGYYFTEQDLPPYPGQVVSESGDVITGKDTIMDGQRVWQEYGLMSLGSIWGHGTYRGPDFTAQSLHMVGQAMREAQAQIDFGASYDSLDEGKQGGIDSLVIKQIKNNRYDPATDTLTLSPAQVAALEVVRAFYGDLFLTGESDGVIRPNVIKDAKDRQDAADFFWWTAWCAGTIRHGDTHTYTNNWPNDPTVGNSLAGDAVVWTAVSLLAFGLCFGVVVYLFHRDGYNRTSLPYKLEPAVALANAPISPSQRKTAKYFLVVSALFFLQVNVGGVQAHYTVHPASFWGIAWITENVPYNLVKTWHLQLAIFWIATSWLGMTLFVSPRVGGKEPVWQGHLVDILFAAVVFVAVGSLIGGVFGIRGLLPDTWFWFGHQGWEYLELGRFWQILLLVGLLIWLGLVLRALWSHFTGDQDKWGLPHFLAYSGVAVVGFFCFGLMYDANSHLVIADFWRWWVVHTWVEGAFEFFAAAAVAFVLINLGLVDLKKGLRAVYFTVALALSAGIIGVGHHYYWFGMPSFWLGLGSVISSLEPVPILLLIAEVWHGQKALMQAGDFPYKYPLMFLIASVFWEFLGAAVMGLAITTPAVNYYEHATYLTVSHGHTALFGTYGMLAIGLLLFSMRGLVTEKGWDERFLKVCFWGVNIGLAVMFLFTLLPVGLLQVLDNMQNGFWHARSNAFWEKDIVMFLGQARMIPDTLIIVGSGGLLAFMCKAIVNLKDATIKDGESFE